MFFVRYLIKRILLIIPTMFVVTLTSFLIINAVPGNFIESIAYDSVGSPPVSSMQDIEDSDIILKLKKKYQLDKPFHKRFLHFFINCISFNFGRSILNDQAIGPELWQRFLFSISFALLCSIISIICSTLLAIYAYLTKYYSITDIFFLIFYSIPNFVIAMFLLFTFTEGGYIKIFPIGGLVSNGWCEMNYLARAFDLSRHLVLPMLVICLPSISFSSNMIKSYIKDEVSKNYVLTAFSKGLSRRNVLKKHVMPNIYVSLVQLFKHEFGKAFTTSIVVENAFNINGLGYYTSGAISNRDYPVIFACFFIYSLIGLSFNIIGDILILIFDKQISLSRRS